MKLMMYKKDVSLLRWCTCEVFWCAFTHMYRCRPVCKWSPRHPLYRHMCLPQGSLFQTLRITMVTPFAETPVQKHTFSLDPDANRHALEHVYLRAGTCPRLLICPRPPPTEKGLADQPIRKQQCPFVVKLAFVWQTPVSYISACA